MIEPTEDDVRLARKMCAWAAAGLEVFRHKLATEFATIRADEREACAKVAVGWAARYPESAFPADGQSLDAKSAAHGRHVANKIADDIRARGDA